MGSDQKAFYAPLLYSDAPAISHGLTVETVPQLERSVSNLASGIIRDASEGQMCLLDDRAEWARVLCVIIVDLRGAVS